MKYLINLKRSIPIAAIMVTIFIAGCQPNGDVPQDLVGLKAAVKEKKTALKTLESEIEMMEAKIAELEPKSDKKTSLVTLDTIQKETLKRYATLQASVMSDELVNPSSEIGGRLTSVTVKEGDYVKRGQLIATVDTDILDKQVAEMKTRLDLATTVFNKQKKLWDQNIGSEIQFLQAKNNKESLEKSLETLQAQLSKKNVYAPVNGAVDQEFLKAGEMASPGMPIVSILNTSKLKITADVPETYLTKVIRGDKVSIYFPALDKEIERKVTLVGRSIDPSNRTFKIEMATDNLKGLLKPNLLAEVKINDLILENTIAIPTELIQQEVSGNEYVYAAKTEAENTVAEKKYVKTGEVVDGQIEILEGINAGDRIVLLGARTIAEGDIIIDENAK